MTDHAAGIPMEALCGVLNATQRDPDLKPFERETIIKWSAAVDSASFYSAEPAVIRRILLHPDAKVHQLRVSDPPEMDREERRFGARIAPHEYESGLVTGVDGKIPIGGLKIPANARDSNIPSEIISASVLRTTHERTEMGNERRPRTSTGLAGRSGREDSEKVAGAR